MIFKSFCLLSILLLLNAIECVKIGRTWHKVVRVLPPRGSGFWSVKGAKYYDAYGREVFFSGVTWSGLEVTGAPGGLHVRSYTSMLDQMKSLGFNCIRLAFAGVVLSPTFRPSTINYKINPGLKGLNSLRVIDKIVAAAAKRKIKIILDYHRKKLTSNPENGIWFDDQNPESLWIKNWIMLAKRYKNQSAVIGFDVFNEVHNSPELPNYPVWNLYDNSKYNFRSAVQRVVNAIQKVNKKAIIFVPGMYNNWWWGGNLQEVASIPVKTTPGKLAYSIHEYGPIVYDQPWFQGSDFPRNLPGLWHDYWGFVVDNKLAPVSIGEFGSFYPKGKKDSLNRREVLWLLKFRDYIRAKKLSWLWFMWGPDSRDTGGILNNDWRTVNKNKLQLLSSIFHPGFGPSPGQ